MAKRSFKIGFSDIGGIFIGKNIQSDFHKHYAVTVIISFGETFSIKLAGHKEGVYGAALVQKNVSYSLKSGKTDYLAFIHIVPYTSEGLKLSDGECAIRALDIADFDSVLRKIKNWSGRMDMIRKKLKSCCKQFHRFPGCTVTVLRLIAG
jgi:hypothetical protein